MHRSGARVVVEIESLGRPRSTLLSYQSARSAMARLAAGSAVDGLVAQLARRDPRADRVRPGDGLPLRPATGTARWSPRSRREDLNPFLGLHYPATDIPAQARRLYTVNWTRLIADVGYAPVPLEPVLDPGHRRSRST